MRLSPAKLAAPRWAASLVVPSLVPSLVLSLVLASPGALADRQGDDHERARAAVRAGEIMPLAELLERLQRGHPGKVLEIELEREEGRWIYEIKLLQSNGRLLKLELDARTAELLDVKRKGEHKSRHDKAADKARVP